MWSLLQAGVVADLLQILPLLLLLLLLPSAEAGAQVHALLLLLLSLLCLCSLTAPWLSAHCMPAATARCRQRSICCPAHLAELQA